jgi:hypothetical protein
MMKNEGVTTAMIEDQTKRLPSFTWMALALGSMAVSAGLALSGRVKMANFIGQWAPSLLIIGVYNKIAKTFSAPIDEEQRLRHGGHPSVLKSSEMPRPQPTM